MCIILTKECPTSPWPSMTTNMHKLQKDLVTINDMCTTILEPGIIDVLAIIVALIT